MDKKKQRKQRSMMYTQQMRLAKLPDWKEEIARIVKQTNPLHWAGILHDKDLDEHGDIVEPHIHLMLYFKHARSPQSVAWEINDKEGKREDAQTERLEFFKRPNNGYSYLIHQTEAAKDKFQYPISDVISNFDFEKKIKSIKKQVERAKNINDGELIKEYLDLLYEGSITIEEIEDELSGSQYAKASNRLKSVAEKRQERLCKEFIHRMKTKGVVKQVIYMYGGPGLGKTRLAKSYAEKEKEPYYITGSSRDPFQSYRNQEIVIIDELRPDTFNYSDLLKILDPYNFDVFLPSRYIDKALTARLIVITSPYSPKQLYDYMLHLKNIDSFEQLERRIGTTILVESDTIYHMLYNPETKSYEKHETENFPNPFLSQQGTTSTDNYFQQFAKTFTEKEVLNDNP
ncbi:Rep family protein [Streptococcus salivarius]|uniref:Replication protein n=1 Tax=Streptococcus salivarius TaxID=1304 RepID=A0AB37CIW3_STRSL|nr:Rep family protein [Streptococcus salivarius]QEM31618.1 replication protein [Streptococcus salivarius]